MPLTRRIGDGRAPEGCGCSRDGQLRVLTALDGGYPTEGTCSMIET